MAAPKLSVVIPTLPGEDLWQDLLGDLAHFQVAPEIIIVVGSGEKARECAVPENAGFRILFTSAGRAPQLNAGAAIASGDYIWFLHADSRLPAESIAAMECALAGLPGRELLYLDLAFRKDGPKLTRLNARGANLRSRFLGLPFGDQGFCISRELFSELGGFEEGRRAGEDHFFVWNCRRQGVELRRINATIRTSARKYRDQGWLNTTVRHLMLTLLQAASAISQQAHCGTGKPR